jgi:hypothetical protein
MGKLSRDYYSANKEMISKKRSTLRRLRLANPELQINQFDRKINTKIKKNIRSRTGSALSKMLTIQIDDLVGADVLIIRKHIESLFQDGMTWGNYGKKWHIDHRIPICMAKTMDEFRSLSHFTNLQPLWAIDNVKKGKRTIF